MGDNADDCYEGVLREMDDMAHADPFFGCGPDRSYYSRPTRSTDITLRELQQIGRVQRELPLEVEPPNRDWKFITIEKTWPFGSRDFLVQQPTLLSALKDFYENEYHQPFRSNQDVPDYHKDVHIQATGGWMVYGETQTVLIFVR